MSTPSVLRLEPEPYYLLRRPLLPLQTIGRLHQAASSGTPTHLLPVLLELYRDPLLQEAIYTASPELHAELGKALAQGTDAYSRKEAERLALTLYKYTLRMSTRCTPYGLFAGCARGQVAGHTAIAFAEQPLAQQSRLDMNYVSELVRQLVAEPALREQLSYYPNNSLYQVADKYRYVECQLQNKRRHYTLTSVGHTPYLAALLDAAQAGAPFAQLVAAIQAAEPTATAEEAGAYVHQLVDAQVLVSELEPTITGPVYLQSLPDRLRDKASPAQVQLLTHILQLLKQGAVDSFRQVHAVLGASFGQFSSKDLIQTDLFFQTTENQLKSTVADTIAQQVSELYRLATKNSPPDLANFSKSFSERFEEQEVPLLLALDSESGVGYGATELGSGDYLPALEGIRPRAKAKTKGTTLKRNTPLVHELYHRALRQGGQQAVVLTEADLATLEQHADLAASTPPSLYAFGSLLAASPQAADAGEFQFALSSCGGPSAANLLGRFCYGDAHLLAQVQATLQQTEPDTEDVVYAELVHLPESRVGNILMRPILRAYEIPFLSPGAVPADHQITVQDLLVSVRQGQVILRSRRLNKRVIPRLSTAHNYTTGLPIYRFLCDLQKDGLYTGVSWHWDMLNDQPFLPRIEYKNIIISKATWCIRREQLATASLAAASPDAQLQAYLAEQRLPRYFCLAEHDNELLIDSEQPAARQLVLQQLEKKGQVRLTEFLASAEQGVVQQAGHAFANELLLPLRNPAARRPAAAPRAVAAEPTRQFAPGSEWVYFKLYGGTKSTDQLLADVVLPVVQRWLAQGLIRQWFFVRYADPQSHLRVRVRLADPQLTELGTVLRELPAALAAALAQGRLHKIQLDTYVRELERYGLANIENSEALFSHDSLATATVLSLLGGDEGEDFRWLLALRGLDELLTDFGLALPEKQQFIQQLSQSFFQEFSGDKGLQVQLNEKYRQESRRIQRFLDPAEDETNGIEEATAQFAHRRQGWQPVIAAIQAQHPGGLLATDKGFALLFSYVHMYVNRFVLSRPRQHELTLYTLLHKYYTAQLARRKSAVPKPLHHAY
jgi:thiopeptide-type bacteriocin biosynthesis protein